MTTGEYITIFAAILVGLAVADIALSFHRLLRAGRKVKWDWLSPVMALIVLCYILNLWWGLYHDYSSIEEVWFGWFLLDVMTLLALFLMSAAVLPDGIPEERLDLRTFYMDNRAHFWATYIGYLVFVIAKNSQLVDRFDRDMDLWMAANIPVLIMIGFSAVLIWSRRLWLHLLMIAAQIYTIASQWIFYVIR